MRLKIKLITKTYIILSFFKRLLSTSILHIRVNKYVLSNMADANDHAKPVVLVLKAENKDDSYQKLLIEHGYQPLFVPVLSFKFINKEDLTERLKNPQQHNGIVFTSQRAVEAVQSCISDVAFEEKWSSSLKEKWLELPVFVTGKATGKQAREKLQFSSIFGEESGNAKALASTILNTLPADLTKELLFPCANIKKETLPNILKEKGYNVHCITAYCTQSDPGLDESLQRLFAGNEIRLTDSPTSGTPSGVVGNTSEIPGGSSETLDTTTRPSCIVFFSPSGVNFAHNALRQTLKSLESIKLVAIGQSTAAELQKHGLVVAGVPDKPDAQSVLKIIDSILN